MATKFKETLNAFDRLHPSSATTSDRTLLVERLLRNSPLTLDHPLLPCNGHDTPEELIQDLLEGLSAGFCAEVVEFFYRNNTFHFNLPNHHFTQEWLTALDPIKAKYLTQVEFSLPWAPFKSNEDRGRYWRDAHDAVRLVVHKATSLKHIAFWVIDDPDTRQECKWIRQYLPDRITPEFR